MILLSLVKLAQANDRGAMMTILQMFEPKIKKSLRSTNLEIREDIRQEIMLRLIQAIRTYETKNVPNFLEVVDRLKK